jgi:hypothetical protein
MDVPRKLIQQKNFRKNDIKNYLLSFYKMENSDKILISYTDENERVHVVHIAKQYEYIYKKWLEVKSELDKGANCKWKGEQRQKAYDALEKYSKKFTYQIDKDKPIDCECGCQVMKCHLARHKVSPKHYKLMDAIENPPAPRQPVAMSNTDIVCECGMIVSKANYARHIKNSRHIKALQKKQ